MKVDVIAKFTTKTERIEGLRGIKNLGINEGVLFEMPEKCNSMFWNLGVDYPIDIAFFDEDKNLISIGQLEAQQIQGINSRNGHYKYVLETNKGWFSRNRILLNTNLEDLIC